MAAAVVGADKKGGKRRLAPAVMLGLLGVSLLAACAPVGPQTVEPGVTIVQPEQTGTEVQGVVIVPTEEPTETPTEVPTETPEPTQEPTATPEPEIGMQNEQGQWWDGAGWLDLPGEGWLVEVLEDGQVQATDANGAEYTWENGGWVQERTLASGLEAFANSGVTGQLEMVYSVHPEIVINEEPAKNFYNYFIEVVTTSKGFEPYWQALGLNDRDNIMNYLENNNYLSPTFVMEETLPGLRRTNGIIVNGQGTDWSLSDGHKLFYVDWSRLGFVYIDDEHFLKATTQFDGMFGPGSMTYLPYGMSISLRFYEENEKGIPILIVKQARPIDGVTKVEDASLKGDPKSNPEFLQMLLFQTTMIPRYLGTNAPLNPEKNVCGRPGQMEINQNGRCIPDSEEGVRDPDFLGVNIHTAKRLGIVDLFGLDLD